MSLYKKTAIGIFWNFLESFGRRGISSIVTIILAKFLVPEDFGLISMLSIFIQLSTRLMDSGFRQALIHKENAKQIDYCTVFYTNIALGMLAYLIMFLIAPLVADFYSEPRLILLLRILSLVIVINSFRVVQEVGLSKKLNFKALGLATLPGTLISGIIAIFLAVKGFGVWALVTQMILAAFLNTIFLWFSYGWRPGFSYSISSLKSMFGYGSNLFLSGLINVIFQNIYVIIIAKLFSTQDAGYYFFASKIEKLVTTQVTMSIQKVIFPALATIQKEAEKLKKGLREIMQLLAYVIFPVTLFTAALTEPIFKALLSDSWLPSVPYLQLMFLAGFLFPLYSVNLNILKVRGRTDLFLYISIITKLLTISVLLISIRFGIYAILIGKIVVSILSYFPNSFYSEKLIGYSRKEQIADIIPSFLLAGVISIGLYSVQNIINLQNLFGIIAIGLFAVFLYIIFSLLFKYKSVLFLKSAIGKSINKLKIK